MRHFYLLKLCLLLPLIHFSISEWVEISQAQSKPVVHQVSKDNAEGFTTPSAVWIEYQRERFGQSQSNSNSHSNPFVVSDAGGLKNSAQIVVPNNSQVIHARTKLEVKKVTEKPPVKVDVLLPTKVETTSRRHSSHVEESAEDSDEVVETVTEQMGSGEETQDDDDNNNDGQLQLPSMQGFLKFLKSMQNTWITKSALSIENKIKLLKRLRDNMMKIIEQQFAVLWQPPEWHRRRRRRRGLLDESSIDFPPEAALMSINFLTFAVFLVKLVLQVVKIIKSKHYSFSGFNINAEVVRHP